MDEAPHGPVVRARRRHQRSRKQYLLAAPGDLGRADAAPRARSRATNISASSTKPWHWAGIYCSSTSPCHHWKKRFTASRCGFRREGMTFRSRRSVSAGRSRFATIAGFGPKPSRAFCFSNRLSSGNPGFLPVSRRVGPAYGMRGTSLTPWRRCWWPPLRTAVFRFPRLEIVLVGAAGLEPSTQAACWIPPRVLVLVLAKAGTLRFSAGRRSNDRKYNGYLRRVPLRRTGRSVVGWSGSGKRAYRLTAAGFRVGAGAVG